MLCYYVRQNYLNQRLVIPKLNLMLFTLHFINIESSLKNLPHMLQVLPTFTSVHAVLPFTTNCIIIDTYDEGYINMAPSGASAKPYTHNRRNGNCELETTISNL